jgi:hypothetical protein
MTARKPTAEALLLGAHDDLHDAHAMVGLLLEVAGAVTETDLDADGLSSPHARQLRLLVLAESKLRAALLALGQAL